MPGVKFRRNLSARSPDAAQPQRSDLGLGQHVLRIAGVTEIRVHQMRRDAAAVTVHILPEPRADAIATVAAGLIDRGVVTEQRKERRQQAGRAHFADKIGLILIVNGHLRRRCGAHHLHAAGPLFPQVGVHSLVPGTGHQGQVLGMAGRVAARRPGAQPVGSQRQPQLQIEAVVQIHDVLHVAQRKYSPSVMIGASVCCCKSRSAACTSAKAGGWPSDRVRKCSTSNCSVSLPSGSQSAAK